MSRNIGTDAVIGKIRLIDRADDPGTVPASGYNHLYTKSGQIYLQDTFGNVESPVGALPKNAILMPFQSVVLTGNSIQPSMATYSPFFVSWRQNTSADGDSWENGFVVDAGTYTVIIGCFTDVGCGKLDVYIDDVLEESGIDFYSGSKVDNVFKTFTVTLTAGYHKIKGVVNGKNASSSGYNIDLYGIFLKPNSY